MEMGKGSGSAPDTSQCLSSCYFPLLIKVRADLNSEPLTPEARITRHRLTHIGGGKQQLN